MAQQDLNQLLNVLLQSSQSVLIQYGEFYPFGAAMELNGEIAKAAAYDGEEHPPSQHIIDFLTQVFKKRAEDGTIRAAGICYDVRIIPPGKTEKSDAICCALEHQSGESINVFLPYWKIAGRDIRYGEIFAEHRTSQFYNRAN